MAQPALKTLDINAFELFQVTYLSHYWSKNVAPFHREWDKVLNDNSEQYVLIESGRGNAKTTKGSVAFALWRICESFDEDMQVASRSGGTTGTATKIMDKVKRELERNEVLIYDYGIKRGEHWGQDRIQVVRGDGHTINFYSVGKRSSIRGSRGTVLIDDPQNSADCRSETVIEADKDWFLEDVLPVIIGDQRLIFIGTPISPLSLCSMCKRLPGWTVLSSPAEEPPGSGKSAWPEQYTDEFLANRLSVMGVDRYASEYLCQPKVSENPVFRAEWFQTYDPTSVQFERLRNHGLYIVAGFDGAESKSTQADYSALVVLGATMEPVPDVYILDVKRARWSTKEGAQMLYNCYSEFQQHITAIESRVAEGKGKDAIREEVEELERIYGGSVNARYIRPVKDKVTRAMAVQSIVQGKRLFYDPNNKRMQSLVDECIMFDGQGAFHDDQVDALVHALAQIKSRGELNEKKQTGPRVVLPGGRMREVIG